VAWESGRTGGGGGGGQSLRRCRLSRDRSKSLHEAIKFNIHFYIQRRRQCSKLGVKVISTRNPCKVGHLRSRRLGGVGIHGGAMSVRCAAGVTGAEFQLVAKDPSS
jgi:hypothetical protein